MPEGAAGRAQGHLGRCRELAPRRKAGLCPAKERKEGGSKVVWFDTVFCSKHSAYSMAVELLLALDDRGHEVAAVVLDRGGQADGKKVAGHLEAG